jgi:sec-independent protein translocase protein TatB
MFDIGWTELLVIAVVAIVVIGPKDLPRAMRTVGQWTTRVKRMAGDFQRQFNEAVREAELEDVRKEVSKLGKIDPVADLRRSLTKAETDLRSDLKKVDDSIAGSLAKPDAVVPVPKVPPAPPPAAEPPAVPAEVAAVTAAPVEAGEVKS